MVYINKSSGDVYYKVPSLPSSIITNGKRKKLSMIPKEDLDIIADEWKMHLQDKRKEQFI